MLQRGTDRTDLHQVEERAGILGMQRMQPFVVKPKMLVGWFVP
jgi:hypothetical protein